MPDEREATLSVYGKKIMMGTSTGRLSSPLSIVSTLAASNFALVVIFRRQDFIKERKREREGD